MNNKRPELFGLVLVAVILLAPGLPAVPAETVETGAQPVPDLPAPPVESPKAGTDKCEHGGARSFQLLPDSDLVGENRYVRALRSDSLHDIACRYNIGVEEIFMANDPAKVDHWSPGEGTRVLIPQRFILPNAPRAGIVVNIPEMRLYFYPVQYAAVVKKIPPRPKQKPGAKGKPAPPKPPEPVTEVGEPIGQATEVITYPISMGRMDWRTPLGKTRVASKVKDPTWTPPESIRREHAAKGDILPAVVPAGPDNPLGAFALKLGVPGYLIHGTEQNYKSFGIGMRVTHGCMRMYNEDVARLFPMVAVGTPVYLVSQTVKLGWQAGALHMEVSQPLDEEVGIPPEKDEEEMSEAELAREEAKTPEQRAGEKKWKNDKRSAYLQKVAMTLIQKENSRRPILLDREAVRKALETPTGVPVEIGKEALPLEAMPGESIPGPGVSAPYSPAQSTPALQGAGPYHPESPATERYGAEQPASPRYDEVHQAAPPEQYPQKRYGTESAAPAETVTRPYGGEQGTQAQPTSGQYASDPWAPGRSEPDQSAPDPYAPDRSTPATEGPPEGDTPPNQFEGGR